MINNKNEIMLLYYLFDMNSKDSAIIYSSLFIQKYVLRIIHMPGTFLSDMDTIMMIKRKHQWSGSLHATQTLKLNTHTHMHLQTHEQQLNFPFYLENALQILESFCHIHPNSENMIIVFSKKERRHIQMQYKSSNNWRFHWIILIWHWKNHVTTF